MINRNLIEKNTKELDRTFRKNTEVDNRRGKMFNIIDDEKMKMKKKSF